MAAVIAQWKHQDTTTQLFHSAFSAAASTVAPACKPTPSLLLLILALFQHSIILSEKKIDLLAVNFCWS
ncbi:unnamed protein product [Hermetia illucens]|uniref:Uncharacterized protein n=1 Tax=Hermetia illucens TaxID=343691 RepID=A0A7R8V6V0_HERIL|nr:unnamed protein product [Hermetia illucens]